MKMIEFVIKCPHKKRAQVQMVSLINFIKHLRKKVYQSYTNSIRKVRRRKHF